MLSSRSRYFILLLLGAAITLPLYSQEVPSAKKSSSTKTNGSQKSSKQTAEGKKSITRKKMDLSSLPADAVIVICDDAKEALDLLPKAVILRPDKYQALLDQIAKLTEELEKPKSDNAVPPTRCVLHGKVASGVLRLKAEFSGTTERADTLVALACSQAGASSAETDGHMALVRRGENGGFLARIEKPGEYHVKLDLLVPLTSREGTRQGFELTLPRAVITQLELDLPVNCTEVRLGSQRFKDRQQPGLELRNNHLSGNLGLGPVDKLDLSWKEARRHADDPVRTAEGRIQARLDGAGLVTEADLWLKAEGAPAKDWSLLVPRNAEIKLLTSENEPTIEHRIETAEQKYAAVRTIHLNEARSEPLHVQVKVPLAPLRNSSSILPIGPFFVLDAVRQTGTVQVRNQVRNLHLDYRGHGDMQLRSLEAEENKGEWPATVATLVYSNIPMVANPGGTTGPKSRSWLDLEAMISPAQVRMRVAHTLSLRHDGTGAGRESSRAARQWEIQTFITPVTKWNDIEQLKVLVPPNWKPAADENTPETEDFQSGSKTSRQGAKAGGNSGSVTIPSFVLRGAPSQGQRLHGRYQASYQAGERAVLKLPRPQGTIELCEIKIEAPAHAEVVLNNAEEIDLELIRQTRPNEQTWRCRNVPADGMTIDVSWRPYRPEVRAFSVVDLTLSGNRGEVSQELRLQLPSSPPPFVQLHVPAAIGDGLQIRDDQGQEIHPLKTENPIAKNQTPSGERGHGLRIPVPAKAGGTEWRLTLQYSFSGIGLRRSDESASANKARQADNSLRKRETFVVPLVLLEQATGAEIKVRCWSEVGFLPRLAGAGWEERNIEEVNGRDLPVLVLHSVRPDAPLRLVAAEQAAGFSALVERSRMRVQLLEAGAVNWRATFQLRQLADSDLDVLFPGPVATLNAQFFLNGTRVLPDIINAKGEHLAGGTIARLHLSPDLVQQPASLEILLHSPPGRTGSSPFRSVLHPPQILRATSVPTCWQVSVPANRVLLAPESGAAVERIWMRRGWLFAAGLSPLFPSSFARLPVAEVSGNAGEPLALVCWQDHEMPMVLTHAPQQGWLLVCSFGLLILGLGLYWSAQSPSQKGGRRGVWFWPLIALLTLACALAALFWPTLICAVAYGCEPGAVVLLAVLAVQWLMHQRYRRQIVFLPSFSRSPSGSSLIRKSSSNRQPSGEPSTVDAPPPVG